MANKINPANKTQDQSIDKFYRSLVPSSINEEKRTVDLVFSTGYRGLRPSWFGEDYYEELEISQQAMRTDRLTNGAPLLFGHNSQSLDALIGVVEKVGIEGENAVARVRFDTDEISDRVFQKVKNGVLRSVSVGYMVYKYEEQEEREQDLKVFRATDWEPVEISFVPVPFDPMAQVRSESKNNLQERSNCIIVTREGKSMAKKGKETKVEEVVEEIAEDTLDPVEEVVEEVVEETAPASDDTELKPSNIPAEGQTSLTSILRSCQRAGLDDKTTQGILAAVETKKMSAAQASEKIIEEWSSRDRKVKGNMDIEQGSYDKMSVLVDGVKNSLLHRMNPGANALDEKGRNFRGLSLVEIGREYLNAVGVDARNLTRVEVATKLLSQDTRLKVRTGFQGTSDFPEILANVANKTLLAAYDRFPQTFRPWTRRSTSPDFKQISRVRLGEGPTLTKVSEHGEFTYGSFGEEAEKYALATYGKIVPFTRQSIINDDLNAFDRVVEALGMNGAELESDIIYSILTTNAAMSDTVPLFHATHKNLGTSGTVDETTLSEMRKLGRKQTGIDGKKLNIVYGYIIVPVALETVAQKAISAVVPNQTSGVNIFAGSYGVIAEPRLDDVSEKNWYAAALPGRVDTIEYCYLEGNESMTIEQEVEFDTDGIKIKARHDFAAKAIDYRGLFKNPYT